MKNLDLFQIESQLWMAEVKTGVPLYDFSFSPLFQVTRPWHTAQGLLVARIGAIADYEGLYDEYKRMSLSLVNSPAEHLEASELEHWYPLVAEFTPKSKVYAHFPSAAELQKDFDYPVFIKGNRQTAKHDPALCIARNEKELEPVSYTHLGVNGATAFRLVPDPNCKKIVSLIDLIDGDIQTGMDEDFLSAPYEQMRAYHTQRENQAHAIIQQNVAVIKELVGLAVSYMKSRDELPGEDELSGSGSTTSTPTTPTTPAS